MTSTEFEQIITKQLEECKAVLLTKGSDYTDNKDRFFNFKQVASLVASTKFNIWAIYFLKHIFAISAFCGRGKLESEPIEGRITDAINYLLLLRGMIEEDRENMV